MAETMNQLDQHGITRDTPLHVVTSAGVFFKNLHYNAAPVTGEKPEPAGWVGTKVGATSGGGKVDITPEYIDIGADGASVAVRGMKQKVGEKATMEMNLIEFRKDLIVDALHLVKSTKSNAGHECYVSQSKLSDADYLDNVAYVGKKADETRIIVIFPNALITGSFTIEGKNKEQTAFTISAECTATFAQSDLEHLPYEIWYPTSATV